MLAICFLIFYFSCEKKSDLNEPECIVQKIEAFAKLSWVEFVIKITKSKGTFYWFVDIVADSGEEIFDKKCILVCITDVERQENNKCDSSIFQVPREFIWKKYHFKFELLKGDKETL